MTYTFVLFGKTYQAETLADASKLFSEVRDITGRGASQMPLPTISMNGETAGHFSYNGKIWAQPSRDWRPGMTPIFDPTV